jgi:hypothetical protein
MVAGRQFTYFKKNYFMKRSTAVKIAACIAVPFLLASCKWFTERKAADVPLQGKWRFTSLDTLRNSEETVKFALIAALALSDSSSLVLDLGKDSSGYFYTSRNGRYSDSDRLVYYTHADSLFTRSADSLFAFRYQVRDSQLTLSNPSIELYFTRQ